MTNNDILIRLRYALDIPDAEVVELFALAGRSITRKEIEGLFRKEEEAGFLPCNDATARAFLSGLITKRRGTRATGEEGGASPRQPTGRLTNNEILKALRVALELRDDDIVAIMALSDTEVTKSEVTALFRKAGHPKYQVCGDQFLRRFLAGLTEKCRGRPTREA